tara:strand:+ start:267 stop:452 length:186 start_codon:yes stop_codon:yes gene_type:complete
MLRKIFKLFKRELDQNSKLIKNIEEYDKKTKAKQQESKILEQRKTRRTKNQKENINVYNTK